MQLARGLDAGEDARHGLTTYAGRVRRRKVRELKDLVDVAKTAAARAATYLRGLTPAAPSDWTEKGPHDFVTDADRAAEALIATTLTSGVPGSTVVGEELSPGGFPRSGDVVWIVDPLDGTTNFLHRYPQYAVSIGCAVDGALCVGGIHHIPRERLDWGARGAGAWQGERRLRVSGLTEARHALVGTGFPFKDLPRLRRYLDQLHAAIGATSGIRRAGSAALRLLPRAAGRREAFAALTPAPWDIAAGVVLIREASGVVTTLTGEDDVLRHGSLVAGSPTMPPWLLDLLKSA